MPIDGLAIEEGIVHMDGFPFSQASTSRRIRTGFAIAIAQKPKLRIMRIEQGNDLDSKGMATIEQLAGEHDMQVFMERVADTDDGVGIFIEEGRIAEREKDDATQ